MNFCKMKIIIWNLKNDIYSDHNEKLCDIIWFCMILYTFYIIIWMIRYQLDHYSEYVAVEDVEFKIKLDIFQ